MTIPATLVSINHIEACNLNINKEDGMPININKDTSIYVCPKCGALIYNNGETIRTCDNCGNSDISGFFASTLNQLMRVVDSSRALFRRIKLNLTSTIPEKLGMNNAYYDDDFEIALN